MCVHGNLIVPLLLATTVVLGLALGESGPDGPIGSGEVGTLTDGGRPTSTDPAAGGRVRPKRRTRDQDEKNNIESSITLWEWLKGRDKPEDNCMLMAIGSVASGGALTGAFVGAGIGSIFTGPGVIVGGIIGGLVGVFGGLSVGARAGAVACDSV